MKNVRRLLALLATAALGIGQLRAAPVTEVISVVIPVTDATRAAAFYTQVLGFHVLGDEEVSGEDYEHLFGVFGARARVVRLQLGEEQIELLQFLTPRGRPLPADVHANDRYFQHIAIIVSDMDQAYQWLRGHGVAHASTGPQLLPQWNPNAGGISAFYFRDPDGNFLEVLHFPPGKGAPRWQSRSALFLGIDHTAIVVGDTDESLRYYRDVLGLRIVGQSENYGSEQEHLNNVFGARLRITTLHADAGPGVELLEYLTPRGGAMMPADSRANDQWYWQINFRSTGTSELFRSLIGLHAALVSNDVIKLHSSALGFGEGFVIRDPDGHAGAIGANPGPRDAAAGR